jgi:hypothetical protein
VSREIGFAPRCAELRHLAAKNLHAVENDRETVAKQTFAGVPRHWLMKCDPYAQHPPRMQSDNANVLSE